MIFTREELADMTIANLKRVADYLKVDLAGLRLKEDIIDAIYDDIISKEVVEEKSKAPQMSVRIRRIMEARNGI